jgi:predicted RNA-binding Zn ribbon-like protein
MPFTFVSGNLALDFAGTLQHRDTTPKELLSSPGLLREWWAESGLVYPPPEVSARAFARAVAVREAVYRLALAAATDGERSSADIDLVNEAAAAPPVTALLTRDGVLRTGPAEAVIASIAREAVGLLGGPDAARIRECEDPPCTRLFLDTSRAGSRRWCDMSGCGNRAKAAGFRARRTAAGSAAHGG